MTEFYVDAPGPTGLYNQFARASGDASDALAPAGKHCHLDWDAEGLLVMLMGPHARHAHGGGSGVYVPAGRSRSRLWLKLRCR